MADENSSSGSNYISSDDDNIESEGNFEDEEAISIEIREILEDLIWEMSLDFGEDVNANMLDLLLEDINIEEDDDAESFTEDLFISMDDINVSNESGSDSNSDEESHRSSK
ncbi:uncharacterized protein LOC120112962 [Phoenix dactylifera]|uniref:Uncharacterized protein LOC120108966 n=1 Tax=Phoenix dactylifera TaxID=42345 RepID=A0A8B9A5S9_PHODC|nr:uncharacterized protein LOC120108966 [Phoenix dactylifera]XP_038989113.1 uncharacterized protein LOC120112962 [Phoenix dactylifera]